jgi:hypothetical protein
MIHLIAFMSSADALHSVAKWSLLPFAVGAILTTVYNRLRGRGKAPLPVKILPEKPILQVELAWKAEQLKKVLCEGDSERNIKDARIGNNLDTFLFIPSYLVLSASVGLILAQGDRRWRSLLVILALVAVPFAAICDWVENSGITRVLDKLKNNLSLDDHDATRISTPSFIKWTTLGFVLLIYGVTALRRPMLWHRDPACLIAWLGFLFLALGGLLLGPLTLATVTRYGLGRWRPSEP